MSESETQSASAPDDTESGKVEVSGTPPKKSHIVRNWIAAIGLGAVLATVGQQLLVQFISSSPGFILGWMNQKQWIDKAELEALRRPRIGSVSEAVWVATGDSCYESALAWLQEGNYENISPDSTRKSIGFMYEDQPYTIHCAGGFDGSNHSLVVISGVANEAVLDRLRDSISEQINHQFRQWEDIREVAPDWWNAPVSYQYDHYVTLSIAPDKAEIFARTGVLPSNVMSYFKRRNAKIYDCVWSVMNTRVCRFSFPGLIVSMRLLSSGENPGLQTLITATTFRLGNGRIWTEHQVSQLIYDIPGLSLVEN